MAKGLNTVNLGDLTGFQQSVLFVLMPIGSVIFVSLSIVGVRRSYFRYKFKAIALQPSRSRRSSEDLELKSRPVTPVLDPGLRGPSIFDQPVDIRPDSTQAPAREFRTIKFTDQNTYDTAQDGAVGNGMRDTDDAARPSQEHDLRRTRTTGAVSAFSRHSQMSLRTERIRISPELRRPSAHHESGFGSFPTPWQSSTVRKALSWPVRSVAPPARRSSTSAMSYLSFAPEYDQRGRPVNLTSEQKDELGGVEYRALKTLTWFLVVYQLFWYAFGIVALAPYGYLRSVHNIIDTEQAGNLSPAW